jgi:hypothetical protein
VTPLAQKLGQDSSSINDLFAGRFASTITCTNCRHVSRSFEAFADLSLELPKSDRIKRIEHESKVKLSKLQDTNRGWFGSVFDYVGLTTPALSLYACLHSFCLSVNLADENKYKCEKCKETVDARKVTSIDRFPEVLSIHIKRFTWGSFNNKLTREVTFPLKNLDMSQFAADKKQSRQQRSSQTAQTTPRDHGSMKYDLTGLIRHMGDTGGGHYISFAKHHVTGQWYKFDDRLVTEVSTAEVEEQEAYVLFYRRQPAANLAAHTQLVKLSVEPVAVEAQSDTDVLVSKRWILNTNTRHTVPPVDNRDLACAHGVLLPALKQSALQPHGAASAPAAELEESDVKGGEESAPVQVEPQDRFVRISEPAFDGLVHAFGGGPKLYATPATCAAEDDEDVEMVGVSGDRCEPCHLQHLRDVERIAAAKADHDPDRDQFFYFLDCDWFNAWRAFVMQGKARPGPISNHTLLVAESDVEELELRPDLQKNKHYRGVYKSVWEFFMEHYGGGPMLRATSLDIYERLLPGQEVEVVEDNEVTMELSPDDDASEVSAGTDTDEREDDDDTQMDTVEDSS